MKCLKSLSVLGVVLATSYAGWAQADLSLDPAINIPLATTDNTASDHGSYTELKALFNLTTPPAPASMSMVYKADVGSPVVEEGIASSFYSTVFSNLPNDPADATITWDGPSWIDCPKCYLVVKDGNKGDPAQYLFDISAWDGKEDIKLTNFWPGNGAISHVEIWSSVGVVPEPQTYALMLAGLGLVGFAASRRKMA